MQSTLTITHCCVCGKAIRKTEKPYANKCWKHKPARTQESQGTARPFLLRRSDLSKPTDKTIKAFKFREAAAAECRRLNAEIVAKFGAWTIATLYFLENENATAPDDV